MFLSKHEVIADLWRDEGFRSHAYQDTEGYWTIGVGRMVDRRLGGGITKAEAAILLENDVARVEKELDRATPFWRNLPEPAQRGYFNMAFQLGLSRLLRFVKMIEALETGDFGRAADECLDSLYAKQTPARASRVAALMRECAPSNL